MSKYITEYELNNLIEALCNSAEEEIMIQVEQSVIENTDTIEDIMSIIRAIENETEYYGEAILNRCSNPECGRTHIFLHFYIPEE